MQLKQRTPGRQCKRVQKESPANGVHPYTGLDGRHNGLLPSVAPRRRSSSTPEARYCPQGLPWKRSTRCLMWHLLPFTEWFRLFQRAPKSFRHLHVNKNPLHIPTASIYGAGNVIAIFIWPWLLQSTTARRRRAVSRISRCLYSYQMIFFHF